MKVYTRPLIFFLTFLSGISAADYPRQTNKAIAYLQKRGKQIRNATVVTLDFLARNYGLKFDTLEARRQLLAYPTPAIEFMLRALDHKRRMPELEIRVMKNEQAFLPTAIHCDVYPLPWDFVSKMTKIARKKGGYPATWAILSLAIIEWQNCHHDKELHERERQVLAERVLDNMKIERPASSLWIECLLALYLARKADKVTPAMLETLIAAQAPDGSWQKDDEVTAKALWVLLLARDSAKPPRKFQIMRTSGF